MAKHDDLRCDFNVKYISNKLMVKFLKDISQIVSSLKKIFFFFISFLFNFLNLTPFWLIDLKFGKN